MTTENKTEKKPRKPMTAETKAKISAKMKGRVGRSGWYHTDDAKAMIAMKNAGKFVSDETRAKMSAAKMGVPKSPAHREAMSAARKLRSSSD